MSTHKKLSALLGLEGLDGQKVLSIGELLDKVHETLLDYLKDIEHLEIINGLLRHQLQLRDGE